MVPEALVANGTLVYPVSTTTTMPPNGTMYLNITAVGCALTPAQHLEPHSWQCTAPLLLELQALTVCLAAQDHRNHDWAKRLQAMDIPTGSSGPFST